MLNRPGPIVFVAAVLVIGILVFRVWQSIGEAGYRSCLESINSTIEKSLADSPEIAEIVQAYLPADGSWVLLRGSEVDPILKTISPGDCSKIKDKSVDFWGNKIAIGLRKKAGVIETRVWSNGPDSAESTKDDIVAPFGKEIPKQID